MSIRAADSLMTDVEEFYDKVVDLDTAEQREGDGKVRDDDLDDLFKLRKSSRYIDIIQKVEDDQNSEGKSVFMENDDSDYNFIVACNALSVDIDTEIVKIHNFIREKYRLKFPELESILHHPIDYARVVKKIRNHMDVNFVDLEGLLPSEVIMEVVSVSGSITIGKPLPEDILSETEEACDTVLALDSARIKVLQFIENRMGYLAPNLSAVVGGVVAVKLICAAGGLSSLAKMPSSDVELLGDNRKRSPRHDNVRPLGVGYISQSGIFKSTPPNFRIQTYVLLAQKIKLAASMDSTREDPTGEYRKSLKEGILRTIEDWQKPRPVPVPVPTESEPCMRKCDGRVGVRVGPIKKSPTYDIMKLVNNMIFGIPEKPSPRYGMLGQVGSSRAADTMSGLSSSSAFTPKQGEGVKLSNSAQQFDFLRFLQNL